MPGGTAAAVLVAIAALVVLGLSLWEIRLERARRRRGVLLALRVATVAAVVAVVLQPRWTAERIRREQGTLAVLADTSRSMVVTATGGEARAERARHLMERWSDGAASERVQGFAFGQAVRAVGLSALARDYPARDDETRILDAIRTLVRDDPGGRLGAAVVVSDGADSTGSAVGELASHGLRVHAVAVGTGADIQDDAIARLEADAVGFLRQPAEVRVVIRSLGREPQTIPVQLRLGEQVVREMEVQIDQSGEGSLVIPFTPERLGRIVYRVTIPTAPDDAVPQNNERAFLVRVTRDKLRVLLVAGRPSWDVRFLRAFLKRDATIDLISFFILRTAADLTMASPDELALIPFPTDELFREHLGSFDVVFFQNFDYAPYGMAPYLPRIRDYVRRGGSFAMIGGDQSFGSGGYADTPLADVLPVDLPPTETPETGLLVTGQFRPRIEPDMARHPLLALMPNPAANAAAWAALAPLEGANIVRGSVPGAQVLLEHPEQRTQSGQPLPLLVVGEAERGRVLALATDTSWRWGITTGGRRGDASAYERFWDRALRWLARDPSFEPCQVTTDRERYGTGAPVRIEARLRDRRYEPLADRPVRLAVQDASGAEVATADARTDGSGDASVELEGLLHPGGYRAVAHLPDEVEPRCDEGFVVEPGGDELADPRPQPEFLRELAAATGGTFHRSPSAAPDLDELDATRARTLGTAEVTPFAGPWAFVVVALLLCTEWLVRRRWGKR